MHRVHILMIWWRDGLWGRVAEPRRRERAGGVAGERPTGHRDDVEARTLYLSTSAPAAGRSWSESGTRREPRRLKHRSVDEVRVVPSPPELTAILRGHLTEHATTSDGRPFRGTRGGALFERHYGRLWAAARLTALSPEEATSPLARRPYDLRHAAVSTWLNGGVPATQVAQWAGHSVDVLLRVYATCIAGQNDALRRRVEQALRDGRS
ncbi:MULTISPECIES: hypothetical protein [unclassified Pseudonocardia]|uniref:hypothetical protein n=1 Tax=unclassified Pseudonocardia TaxID=2619320 RepID=UPI001CF6BD5A|nr:hypothetical protein [Pseudonocardia sp. ICBG162]